MCICGGLGEAAVAVAAVSLVVRTIKKRRNRRPVCSKCGAPKERLKYNSSLCFDCYNAMLDAMQYERGCNDSSPDR
jgi:transcription elongation factor Elf1